MTLADFVSIKFGSDVAATLKKINQGGTNNQKGTIFENHFAISKICEYASDYPEDVSDIHVTAQEIGFVDDICIQNTKLNKKINYQAKNSALGAADWTCDTTTRFSWQYSIDLEFHNCEISNQVLLVSCEQKKQSNDAKIPKTLKEYAFCEYFPYCKNNLELLQTYFPLRNHLEGLTGYKRLDQLDYALKLLSGVWGATTKKRSIKQIFDSASCDGFPNVFFNQTLQNDVAPEWLTMLIHDIPSLHGMNISVESMRVKVEFNGFEATANLVALETKPDPGDLDTLTTPLQLINFVFNRAQAELNQA
jgi:hypothetical protein